MLLMFIWAVLSLYVVNVYAVNVAPLKWPRLNKCLIKTKLAERFGEEYPRNRVGSRTKHTQAVIVGVELGLSHCLIDWQ
jgi:hypothetical protein